MVADIDSWRLEELSGSVLVSRVKSDWSDNKLIAGYFNVLNNLTYMAAILAVHNSKPNTIYRAIE